MNKRLVSLLLCGALAFSLTACGGGGDMSPAATPEPAADTAAAEDTAADAAAEDTAADASADTSADASADTAAAGTTITVMASQDWVEDSEQELGKKFEEQTGNLIKENVKLENEIDASIIGGIKILIDGKVIDATLRKRLDDLGSSILNEKGGEQ